MYYVINMLPASCPQEEKFLTIKEIAHGTKARALETKTTIKHG
jgi:hypothetical protein